MGVICSFNRNSEILFKIIKSIEKKIGRFKTKKNDPRVCDIDIIDYNSDIIRALYKTQLSKIFMAFLFCICCLLLLAH
ncbi:MAG: 2-amino-4-hydroxy-6-hydroxymethyldihydropteridine diphosphokinase [Flavobacteriaceae bacterium]